MKRMLPFAMAFLICLPAHAQETGDIGDLEKRLIQTEQKLLDSELRMDRAIQQNWKFRGIMGWLRGWFHGSEKKAVEAMMQEADAQIRKYHAEVRSTEGELQQEVFNVGYMHEQKGDFATAIEFYLKVADKTDKVKERLAWCHRQLGQYQEAVTWYLKMTQTDKNFLPVAETYWEASLGRDAITWLFRILEPFERNDAELRALELIEEYDYAQRESDFPGFNKRLAQIWLNKALSYFDSEYAVSVKDYQKAIELRAEGRDPRLESGDVVAFYRGLVDEAQATLEDKRNEAYEHYEYLLKEAERKVVRAREKLSDAERQAYRDYEYALDRSRRELSEARIRLNDLKANSAATPEQIQYAERRLRDAEYRLQDLMNNRRRFIENEIEPYKRRLDQAEREHTRLIQSRQEIINDYIRPYEQRLARAQENERRIFRLHSEIYR